MVQRTPTADQQGFLAGQCLIAMPGMSDPRFQRSVVFLCAHSDSGASGIIINKVREGMTFNGLCEQLDIAVERPHEDRPVFFGGPVEMQRGFVLHARAYPGDATTLWAETGTDGPVGLTATLDALRAMASDAPPPNTLLALGYAGWGPGQLETEIGQNGWLSCAASHDLLFGHDIDTKWTEAFAQIGVRPELLSFDAGHA